MYTYHQEIAFQGSYNVVRNKVFLWSKYTLYVGTVFLLALLNFFLSIIFILTIIFYIYYMLCYLLFTVQLLSQH